MGAGSVTQTEIVQQRLDDVEVTSILPHGGKIVLTGSDIMNHIATISSGDIPLTLDEQELQKRVDEELMKRVGLPPYSFSTNVIEFNRLVLKIDQRPIGMLSQDEYDISVNCLQEELDEFQEAFANGDLVGMVDAITDLKYFADGVLYKMGLKAQTIDKVGYVVHCANMEKKLGVNAKRGDGSAADAVKPQGWVPPEERIVAILDEQQAEDEAK